MNITLDGFIAGPHCELDWHFSYWNNEMSRYASEQLALTDTILLGRVTYNAMAKYWPSVAMDASIPRDDIAFADMMNTHAKVVFSSTLKQANWHNSTLIASATEKEVTRLKRSPGKSMIIYGSSKLAQSLMQAGLIDEYILWTYPVILGEGKPLFHELKNRSALRLVETKLFSSGVVLMDYEANAD